MKDRRDCDTTYLASMSRLFGIADEFQRLTMAFGAATLLADAAVHYAAGPSKFTGTAADLNYASRLSLLEIADRRKTLAKEADELIAAMPCPVDGVIPLSDGAPAILLSSPWPEKPERVAAEPRPKRGPGPGAAWGTSHKVEGPLRALGGIYHGNAYANQHG